MNKIAAIQGQKARIDRIILENLEQYSAIRLALAELVEDPSNDETVEKVDITFKRITQGLEELGNSLNTFANIMSSEDGSTDYIDGRDEGNGVRLI